MTPPRRIILASSSPYRRALLERLGVQFEVASPGVDETAAPGEAPRALAERLAAAKAARVAAAAGNALVIASDQVAALEGAILAKPGAHEAAREQLRRVRGRTVRFITALCVMDAAGGHRCETVEYQVRFRDCTDDEIDRYLEAEQPYDCAGAFKSEGLGAAMVDCMDGPDPTALIGLPLVALSRMLRESGVAVP